MPRYQIKRRNGLFYLFVNDYQCPQGHTTIDRPSQQRDRLEALFREEEAPDLSDDGAERILRDMEGGDAC